MATLQKLAERLQNDTPLDTREMIYWTQVTEINHADSFYGPSLDEAKNCVRFVLDKIVKNYLNNPNINEVPLDQKTRACVILNNFALYKPIRGCIFDILDKLEVIFENSIKEDGSLPFNPELGRMTEHVAVLLMRVTDYKLKAANVLEFTDGDTQFAVQLMLAVLLKIPVYELELRCNCITIIHGFTQPQAFFDPSKGVEDNSCEEFTDKIDFILALMLRLRAVQVLSDVLTEQLDVSSVITPQIHLATCSAMRCVMNIFRFSSKKSTQWRQHILLSTTLLDHSVTIYLLMQCEALQAALNSSSPVISMEIFRGMSLGFKFASLCTFRMHKHAKEVRLLFPYMSDMLEFSIRPAMRDSVVSTAFMRLYVDMFHFMANVDALGVESSDEVSGGGGGEVPQQLRAETLRREVEEFLRREVAPGGVAALQAWHTALKTVAPETLVERDSATFAALQEIFTKVEAQAASASASAGVASCSGSMPTIAAPAMPPPPTQSQRRLLGDMPPLRPKAAETKVSIESAAAPVYTAQRIAVVRREEVTGVDTAMLCALTGNVMKKPVISPYGHTFDQEAILAWLQQNGSVCPITGKPLTEDSLKPNKEVSSLIMRQVIQQSMSAYNRDNESDLYDF